MNRLLTSIVQLSLLAIAIPMLIVMIKDIKDNGLG
jgi:hypothetical protein